LLFVFVISLPSVWGIHARPNSVLLRHARRRVATLNHVIEARDLRDESEDGIGVRKEAGDGGG
jgi:hypothetical protein